MNYIGSKKSLLPYIEKSVCEVTGGDFNIFMDLFAGTGIVGQHFKKKGYQIITNDLQYYSYVLNQNYIANHTVLEFNNLLEIKNLQDVDIADRSYIVCNYLNNIPLNEGFIFDNYCLGGKNNEQYKRQYFSDINGKKVDSIRMQIEEWKLENQISSNEYFFLLTSLLENIDKVANTASVYGAYLKKLKKTAQVEFQMLPAPFHFNEKSHEVYNEDIETLIQKVNGDVLYLDPPYNHRQYSSNYHILETIAKYDDPLINGKTGLRDYSHQKSKFSQKGKAKKSFDNIIANARAKYIFVSYNNEGILSFDDIKQIMAQRGEYGFFEYKYGRFKADKDENRNHKSNSVSEFLHYVICD